MPKHRTSLKPGRGGDASWRYSSSICFPYAEAPNEPETRTRRRRELAIFLIDLLPDDMERRLGDALAVYVDAMRYPRGTENQRAAMWLEHIRRRGWQGAGVVETQEA